MSTNPVEDNFVTRFILGFAVLVAISLGAGLGGLLFEAVGVPWGIGYLLGGLGVFLGFSAWYTRYHRRVTGE